MSGVHFTETVHGTAILDTRTGSGRWRTLDPVGTQLWNLITDGTPAHVAIDIVTSYWAARGNNAVEVRADLGRVVAELSRAQLLGPAVRTLPPSGKRIVRTATTDADRTRGRIAVYAGLALALVLLRCAPIRWTIAVARAAVRLPGRPATIAQAQTAHAAVRHAARLWPGRVACLEESLGVHFASAFTGRRTRWVLGVSLLPPSPHAWIETDDATVIGQADEDRVWPYVPVLWVDTSN
ncbi:lasso peptide biosynthesis B2 protein [Streptomyces sp. 5-10]|uniref:lasso peptide biosynthesis B2 protein n=1 Tax=Streptomyces sp. 5-10 TaxID=878925 RepID=UPI00168A9283|nr:lasso peptide biosynthesis B2 protein [Streptomyces sp. 5-10]MBD3004906.1 lasso peptide biosynthesis B2 protein [Streptomyces sp. 5-10]